MWYKTAVTKGPQQLIKLCSALLIGYLYVDRVIQSIRLFRKSAGKTLPVCFSACFEYVKIDL